MNRLVFVVSHCSVIDVCHFVESEFAIEAQTIIALFRLVTAITKSGKLLHFGVTWFRLIAIENSPGPAASDKLQSRIYQTQPTTVFEAGVKVPHLAQFRDNPAFIYQLLITLQLFSGEIAGK